MGLEYKEESTEAPTSESSQIKSLKKDNNTSMVNPKQAQIDQMKQRAKQTLGDNLFDKVTKD
jgi:hypothetical protein